MNLISKRSYREKWFRSYGKIFELGFEETESFIVRIITNRYGTGFSWNVFKATTLLYTRQQYFHKKVKLPKHIKTYIQNPFFELDVIKKIAEVNSNQVIIPDNISNDVFDFPNNASTNLIL